MTVEHCKTIARQAIEGFVNDKTIDEIAGLSVDEVMNRLENNTDLFDGFYFNEDGSEFHGNQTDEEFLALLKETLIEGIY